MVNRHPPRKLIPYRTPKANPDAGGRRGSEWAARGWGLYPAALSTEQQAATKVPDFVIAETTR
jgi:hypothetical protein